jgi:hypothetical protein
VALRHFDRLLAEHHAQQAYERDQRRGRGSRLDTAMSDANGDTHHERDKIANHAAR